MFRSTAVRYWLVADSDQWITISVILQSDTSDTETNANVSIAHNTPVPAGSSIKPFADNKQVLQATDVLRVSASGSADVSFSILEIT